MPKKSKLKNCPFCNKPAMIVTTFSNSFPGQKVINIGCDSPLCPCWIPPIDTGTELDVHISDGYFKESDAIKYWNLRAYEK